MFLGSLGYFRECISFLNTSCGVLGMFFSGGPNTYEQGL